MRGVSTLTVSISHKQFVAQTGLISNLCPQLEVASHRLLLFQSLRFSEHTMARCDTNKCEWNEEEGGYWLCLGGILEHPVKIISAELRAQFPVFYSAVTKLCESSNEGLVSPEDVDILFGIAGLALTESVPRRQCFQLYRHAAFYFGFKDRTELPAELESGIRAQWSEPGETFVVFQPAE